VNSIAAPPNSTSARRPLEQPDAALKKREYYAGKRDEVADQRDRIADLREQAADERERVADESIYYFTRYVNPHSYIGIQPAHTGEKLTHRDQAVGINHIALWARSRKEVDRFHREFLLQRVIDITDAPKDYPQYWGR
jgi:hypothetical protein